MNPETDPSRFFTGLGEHRRGAPGDFPKQTRLRRGEPNEPVPPVNRRTQNQITAFQSGPRVVNISRRQIGTIGTDDDNPVVTGGKGVPEAPLQSFTQVTVALPCCPPPRKEKRLNLPTSVIRAEAQFHRGN
jgi:hypothetical protein